MMSHVEWATSIPDNDEYNYDRDVAPSDPDSDSPLNDDTRSRIDEFLTRQRQKQAEDFPSALNA
eukprot:9626966-Karenia_brevis.AAC.1